MHERFDEKVGYCTKFQCIETGDILDFIESEIKLAKKEMLESKDLEIWLLRLHNEPDFWTVKQALDSLKQKLLALNEE